MLVLFDNNVPRGLARSLSDHTVVEARELGYAMLRNQDLMAAGEAAGFKVLLRADKNIWHQQNHEHRTLALVVLTEQRRKFVRQCLMEIAAAVNAATPDSYTEVEIPFR